VVWFGDAGRRVQVQVWKARGWSGTDWEGNLSFQVRSRQT
jgi:hypothetical protein